MKAGTMWFAVDAEMVYDPFIRRLIGRYGLEGMAVWVALLATAKLSPTEGVVRFADEGHGWHVLGLDQVHPEWPLRGFLSWTGQQGKTQTRYRRGMHEVRLRAFAEWQNLRPVRGSLQGRSRVAPGSLEGRSRVVPGSLEGRSRVVRGSFEGPSGVDKTAGQRARFRATKGEGEREEIERERERERERENPKRIFADWPPPGSSPPADESVTPGATTSKGGNNGGRR